MLETSGPDPAPSNENPELTIVKASSPTRFGISRPPGGQRSDQAFQSAKSTCSADRTDALWAEMQATLDEVELSASGDTHVFGPGHDRKLAALRSSQIVLAQAWARSEADDAIETAFHEFSESRLGDGVKNKPRVSQDCPRPVVGETAEMRKSVGVGKIESEPSAGRGPKELDSKLEEETELDTFLAAQRRDANDEYFDRVNRGVIDVVTKLEDVALAMRAVEQESKEVWNEVLSISDERAD
ncbi:hypothetical protein XA68_11852 [Ophiocordyceps unilateralis]|uniref:Uncharacterized protein n=1 Tax=Ophiocordyceps unilateralis TaxID=268505 RepID=A0A2A9NXM2_OPHUN|nr:hypothetical protein XA68_11852 [Ophiocordyceps unilateralis]